MALEYQIAFSESTENSQLQSLANQIQQASKNILQYIRPLSMDYEPKRTFSITVDRSEEPSSI